MNLVKNDDWSGEGQSSPRPTRIPSTPHDALEEFTAPTLDSHNPSLHQVPKRQSYLSHIWAQKVCSSLGSASKGLHLLSTLVLEMIFWIRHPKHRQQKQKYVIGLHQTIRLLHRQKKKMKRHLWNRRKYLQTNISYGVNIQTTYLLRNTHSSVAKKANNLILKMGKGLE